MAFYEPFNEMLATISRDVAEEFSTDSWMSHHPSSIPYFREYMPLLKDEGGVVFASSSFAFARFVPQQGFSGPLTHQEQDYLASLVGLANDCGRVPVFGCCRSLGRINGIKRSIGGFHICLYRGLLDEWASYVSQYDSGNHYFIRALRAILVNNLHVKFFADLADRFTLPDADDGYGGFEDIRAAGKAFFALHASLYARAMGAADITISVSALRLDASHRKHIEDIIERATGITIDLSDVQREISTAILGLSLVDLVEVRELVEGSTAELSLDERHRAVCLIDESAPLLVTYVAARRDLEDRFLELQAERATAAAELRAMQNSRLWRATAPVRAILNVMKRESKG